MLHRNSTEADIERLIRNGDTAGLVRSLETTDPDVREAAVRALVEAGVSAIGEILRVLARAEDTGMVEGCGEVIRRMGRRGHAALTRALKHENEQVRASAASGLAYTGTMAIPALLEALDDPSWEVRVRSAESLERAGWRPGPDEIQKNVVCHLIRRDFSGLLRIQKSAFLHLVTLSGQGDQRLRLNAIRALGRIGNRKAIPALVSAIRDPGSDIRAAAVEAIGDIGGLQAQPHLVRALADPGPDVRMEAILGLEKSGWQPNNTGEKVRYLVAKGQWDDLSAAGTDSIPVLLDLLAGSDMYHKRKIAGVLAGFGAPAIKALKRAAAGNDTMQSPVAGETLALIREGLSSHEGSPEKSGTGNISWVVEDGDEAELAAGLPPKKEPEESPQAISSAEKIRQILPALNDPDPTLRVSAVEALRPFGTKVIQPLERSLSDTDRTVRVAAVEALGAIRNRLVVPYLLRRLRQDREAAVRSASAESLGIIGDIAALPFLLRAFGDADPGVRSAAAAAAGRYGAPALRPLVSALRSTDARVRSAVFMALGGMEDPAVLPLILNGINDRDVRVAGSATEALCRYAARSPDRLFMAAGKVLRGGTRKERLGLITALERSGDKRGMLLIRTAAREDADPAVRQRASEALRSGAGGGIRIRHKPQLLPGEEQQIQALIAQLTGADSSQRDALARRFRDIGIPSVRLLIRAYSGSETGVQEVIRRIISSMQDDVIDELLDIIGNADAPDRMAAVMMLGNVPHKRAELALDGILTGSPDPSVRRLAAEALGNSGRDTGILPLADSMKEGDGVGEAAIRALGRIGSGPAIDALITSLASADDHDLQHIADALSACGRDAQAPLTAALRSGDATFRRNVSAVMDLLGWTPDDLPGKISYCVARRSWDELKAFGVPAAEDLVRALDDPDEINRAEIARVIGLLGHQTQKPLIGALSSSGSLFVRQGAATALGYLGKPGQAPLVRALRDKASAVRDAAARSLEQTGWKPPEVRHEVRFALARQDWEHLIRLSRDAVPVLVRAMDDEDPVVAAGAVQALGKIGDTRAIPYLIRFAEKSGDTEGIIGIIAALGSFADNRVREFLTRALYHPVFAIRKAAARKLESAGWEPARDRDRIEYFIALGEAGRLAALGGPAVPALISTLGDDQVMGRLVVTEALILMGSEGIEGLLAVARGDDPRLGGEAQNLLAVIGQASAGPGDRRSADLYPPPEFRGRTRDMDTGTARALLGNPDPQERIAALTVLGRSASGDIAKAIIQLAGDPVPEVRRAALTVLGQIGDIPSLSCITGAFIDPDPGVRSEAIHALVASGFAGIRAAVSAAEDHRRDVRLAAIEALGQMSGIAPVPPLVRGLGDDDAEIRAAAARALAARARDPDTRVLDVLAEILADADRRTRISALDALAGIQDLRALDLIHMATYDRDPDVQKTAGGILKLLDPATISLIESGPGPLGEDAGIAYRIESLSSDDEPVRSAAADDLVAAGKAAAGPLLAAIPGADRGQYNRIMDILGRMGADITDELGAALYNEDPATRMAAVCLISRYKNRATVLALGDALPYEPEIRIKKAIAELLGAVGDTAGIVILARLLEDPDTGIRSAAIRSLGIIRDPAAVEPLARQLGSDDDEVLYLAREALILQGTPACRHLAGLLPEGDHQLRTIVADILESLRCIPEDPEGKACFLIGKERWYELETIGEPALGPLRSTLSDTTTHARLGAVMAIGRIGGADAAGLLITALNDDSPIVRKRAENALIAIGTTAASLLETARQSGRLRYPATAERILEKIRPGPDTGRQIEP